MTVTVTGCAEGVPVEEPPQTGPEARPNYSVRLDSESSDDILKAVTARLMSRQPDYRCVHCGFSGHTHHWQCPSCRKWSATKKIHGVLGE